MKALVLGDATCVYADAAKALALFELDAVAATNNIGIDWPTRVDYWCTLHPEKCPNWNGIVQALARRRMKGGNRPQIWSHRLVTGVDKATKDWSGSTGLLCVKVLLEEGFDHIVLAGVPMSRADGHYYDTKPWLQFERYHVGWRNHLREIAPYVRSMSGWTQELLGEPTKEWLNPSLRPDADASDATGRKPIRNGGNHEA